MPATPAPPDRGATHPACELRGVALGYGGTPILERVNLRVMAGEAVALVGASGSGKSSLLLALAGLLTPVAGTVRVDGEKVAGNDAEAAAAIRRRTIGIVFQFGELVPELTLVENASLPLRLVGARRRAAERHASVLFEELGIGAVGHRRPHEVSGGQAQRAAIARALVHQPSLVLADEPTGALGEQDVEPVFDLLVTATRERGAALVLATHDLGLAGRLPRRADVVDRSVTERR